MSKRSKTEEIEKKIVDEGILDMYQIGQIRIELFKLLNDSSTNNEEDEVKIVKALSRIADVLQNKDDMVYASREDCENATVIDEGAEPVYLEDLDDEF